MNMILWGAGKAYGNNERNTTSIDLGNKNEIRRSRDKREIRRVDGFVITTEDGSKYELEGI